MVTVMPMTQLEGWVVTENIVRFQKQLETETDETRRKMLERLLANEHDRAKAQYHD
jgi:hypothetical protein